jgi:hypothetical protein
MLTVNSYLHLGTDGCFQIQGSPRTVSYVEKIAASYRESTGLNDWWDQGNRSGVVHWVGNAWSRLEGKKVKMKNGGGRSK